MNELGGSVNVTDWASRSRGSFRIEGRPVDYSFLPAHYAALPPRHQILTELEK
jgi:hypothetical protein